MTEDERQLAEETFLKVNRIYNDATEKLEKAGFTYQGLEALIKMEREEKGGVHAYSPIVFTILNKAKFELAIKNMAQTNSKFTNFHLQEALENLIVLSYEFVRKKISDWDYNEGVFFDRYFAPYMHEYVRNIQEETIGISDRDKRTAFEYGQISLDAQYDANVDEDGYNKLDVEANSFSLKNPESIYIAKEHSGSQEVLDKYLRDNDNVVENKDLFYFGFIHKFMGGPDNVDPNFYQKEVEFFFDDKEFEMINE